MFECKHCGSATKAMVQMIACAPSEMMHNFTKANMRSKDFELMGVLWETADFLCQNKDCGRVTDGYGNYVTNLKKENQRLREAMTAIKAYEEDTKPVFHREAVWNLANHALGRPE